MKFTKYILGALLLTAVCMTAPVYAQGLVEEDAPVEAATFASPLEESIYKADTLPIRLLESDFASIPSDVLFIATYVESSKMSAEQKEVIGVPLASMTAFFGTTDGTTMTPVSFMLASNEVYRRLNDFLYEQTKPEVPAHMYQLRYLARKLQFEVLDGNWKEIEENTADSILVLVSDVQRSLQDPALWESTLRPINNKLNKGVADKDVALTYAASQGYLNAAPIIETAVVKQEAIAEVARVEARTNSLRTFGGVGLVVLLLAGVIFFFLRRRHTTV